MIKKRRRRRSADAGNCLERNIRATEREVLASPLSTYSSPRGLRQDPGRVAESPVVPMNTSAFNLPEHLAAKAAPTLIAVDEQHFAAIAQSLEHSIVDLSDRL